VVGRHPSGYGNNIDGPDGEIRFERSPGRQRGTTIMKSIHKHSLVLTMMFAFSVPAMADEQQHNSNERGVNDDA
jgi:hypothetical protein